MDSSSEVSQSNYRDEKEAVKSMARSLKVPSGRSKASVITYGIISSRVVKFNSYRTFSALESAIDRAPTIGGVRRIDRALEDAGRLLSEARASVRRSVILLTSGRADPSSRDLYEAAKSIFEEKAELFIIAIGRRPYEPELTAVVKKPEHVFNVSSFSNLEKESEKVTRSVVQIPRKYTTSNKNPAIDQYFRQTLNCILGKYFGLSFSSSIKLLRLICNIIISTALAQSLAKVVAKSSLVLSL